MRKKWLMIIGVVLLVIVLFLAVGFMNPIVGQLLKENADLKYRVAYDEELLFRQIEYTIHLQYILDNNEIEYEWYRDFLKDYLYPNGETLYECVEERMEYYEWGSTMSR